MTTSSEDPIELLLSSTGSAAFPAEVRDQLEQILRSGQSLEPAVRQRLIDAAVRGLTEVSRRQSCLAVLLRAQRDALRRPVETIAEAARLDPEVVCGVECGETPIESQSPTAVGLWARNLGLDEALVETALRASLRLSGSEVLEELRPRGEDLTDQQEAFITAVLAALAKTE